MTKTNGSEQLLSRLRISNRARVACHALLWRRGRGERGRGKPERGDGVRCSSTRPCATCPRCGLVDEDDDHLMTCGACHSLGSNAVWANTPAFLDKTTHPFQSEISQNTSYAVWQARRRETQTQCSSSWTRTKRALGGNPSTEALYTRAWRKQTRNYRVQEHRAATGQPV